ncbi:hypothetical protein FOZ63_005703, partial [Perkinsus olseni]
LVMMMKRRGMRRKREWRKRKRTGMRKRQRKGMRKRQRKGMRKRQRKGRRKRQRKGRRKRKRRNMMIITERTNTSPSKTRSPIQVRGRARRARIPTERK